MFSINHAGKLRSMSNSVTNIVRKRGRPPGPNSRAGDGKNQSLIRALTLLERLSAAPGGVNLTDLSQQLGMPAATVHRLLSTFEELDFDVNELLSLKRIIILACGTSWHAGFVAAYLIEDMARIPAASN